MEDSMSKPTLKKLQQAMSELDTLVSDPLSTNEQIDAAKAAVEELFSRLGVLLEDARREFAELMAQRANDTSSTFLARLRAYVARVFAVDEPIVVFRDE
jgi:hypothetical protein